MISDCGHWLSYRETMGRFIAVKRDNIIINCSGFFFGPGIDGGQKLCTFLSFRCSIWREIYK